MSTQHDFTPEELLNGFVDGELDGPREEYLFDRLAVDSDLRIQLRDMRAIRSALLSYPAVLTPPPSYTEATFARLGFPVIPLARASHEAAGPLAAAGTFFGRWWLHMLAALTVAILTFSVMYTVFQNNTGSSTDQQSFRPKTTGMEPRRTGQSAGTPSESADRPTTGPAATSAAPLALPGPETEASEDAGTDRDLSRAGIGTSRVRSESAATKSAARTSRSQDIRQAQPEATGEDIAGQRLSEPPVEERRPAAPGAPLTGGAKPEKENRDGSPLSDFDDIPVAGIAPWAPVSGQRQTGELTFVRDPFAVISFPPRLEAGFRWYSMGSNPSATIASKSDPLFQDMTAAVRYRITPEHVIGVEAGQEAFAQHYQGSENGLPVRYEQNQLTLWAAAQYQYRPAFRFFGLLAPFVSVSAGSTVQTWPLLRTEAGLRIAATRYLAFSAAAEGSLLLYPFQSTWFTTSKAGLSLGVAFSLGAP